MNNYAIAETTIVKGRTSLILACFLGILAGFPGIRGDRSARQSSTATPRGMKARNKVERVAPPLLSEREHSLLLRQSLAFHSMSVGGGPTSLVVAETIRGCLGKEPGCREGSRQAVCFPSINVH